MRFRHGRADSSATTSDLSVVKRAGRIAAVQASLALTVVLVVVGGALFVVYARAQSHQIDAELQTVAMTADDASDPPPDMELAMRTSAGRITTSDGGQPGVALLDGPAGYTYIHTGGRHYRALVVDRPDARVAAMMDMAPHQAGRARLLMSLGVAELAGIVASIAVVTLFSRRSVRPLAQALALQRRFVADASHELRAPLTVLHTRAQMLAHKASIDHNEEVQKDADALVADARVLSDIVDDLLASATMTQSKPAGDRVDLSAVAESVHDSMTPYANSLGVTVTYHEVTAGSGGFAVIGSEAALRRALTSLVDNALGHEHQGGTIELRVRRADSKVIVAVVDDGTGIDADTMATLFTRFTHGAQHTTRGHKPHGIGLALVREIAQAHGGDITVESLQDKGSTFTLTLPAAPAD
jgi:signal transduction histidine kinase